MSPKVRAHTQRNRVGPLCRDEEISFGRTLQKGLERFNKAKGAAQGSLFSGRDAFELYDTFGFPPDLTQVQLPAQDEAGMPILSRAKARSQHRHQVLGKSNPVQDSQLSCIRVPHATRLRCDVLLVHAADG